ncbi:hypothetical protein ACET3Z_006418 [Daucus carota]
MSNTILGNVQKGSLKTSQYSGGSTAESVVTTENQHKYFKETCPAKRKSFLNNRIENNKTRIPTSRGAENANPGPFACSMPLCQSLHEEQFKPIIIDNYFKSNHFWFELDHVQTDRKIQILCKIGNLLI